jgi:chromosome segregation ATPase
MGKPWKTDYGNKFEFKGISLPKVNKRLYIILLILVSISVLSYVEYTRGNYIQVLEQNTTDLEDKLGCCYNETKVLDEELNSCDTSLKRKESSLEICKSEKDTLKSSLTACEGDSNNWRSDYQFCIEDLDRCEDLLNSQDEDLEDCETDLDNYKDDYDELRENYAEDYCCLLQETDSTITHYTESGNKINCGTSGTELSC